MVSQQGQHRCPFCASKEIVRSYRRKFERIFPFLKPYRCNDCHRRFYDLKWFRLPSRVL
jgi:transposase-like protein